MPVRHSEEGNSDVQCFVFCVFTVSREQKQQQKDVKCPLHDFIQSVGPVSLPLLFLLCSSFLACFFAFLLLTSPTPSLSFSIKGAVDEEVMRQRPATPPTPLLTPPQSPGGIGNNTSSGGSSSSSMGRTQLLATRAGLGGCGGGGGRRSHSTSNTSGMVDLHTMLVGSVTSFHTGSADTLPSKVVTGWTHRQKQKTNSRHHPLLYFFNPPSLTYL
jgi:hypothetical protein